MRFSKINEHFIFLLLIYFPYAKSIKYESNAIFQDHAPQHENQYDGVVASEIIEHIDNSNKELFVKSCLRTLKPGGRIFFTTPNRTIPAKLSVICMAENVLRIVPRGTHQYEKFTTPTELTFLLERSEFLYFLPNDRYY